MWFARRGWPFALGFFLFAFCLLLFDHPDATYASAADAPELIETGRAAKLHSPNPAPTEIKIVSYNMRWRGGDDLRELIELLRSDPEIGKAPIIGLQEIDRNKKRTGNVNTARLMAEELGMHYAWAAPPSPQSDGGEEEETGVAILSAYPLADVQRIVLPNEGPGGRRRAALGATVKLGSTEVRVYSVHAETRTSNERRLQQFQAVLNDFRSHHATIKRAIVLGDFNTITGKDVRATFELFTKAGFRTPFSNDESTWKTFILELKLDWVWLRGLEAVNHGIDKKIGLSDHWPLWAVVRINEKGRRTGGVSVR